jgi:anthraniloyl-CoA monooxygenase
LKIVCVGAGPAGLHFAILSKLRDPATEVTVLERNPRGVTNGWGVVFWDDLVHGLRRSDAEVARQILADANQWHDQEVQVGEAKPARMGGYGYSIGRARLLDILTARAESLGVRLEFGAEVDATRFADADLVVAADGANSRTRATYADHFQPTIESGRNYYIWLGTRKLFDIFTFAFEETPAGWVWLHGYRFSDEYSTCIFECSPETWHGLGLDTMELDDGIEMMAKVFARELDGHELINQTGRSGKLPWLRFTDITNQRWYHQNVVLLGDAAHTTHFSIGSGTKLAIEDAIGLDQALRAHAQIPDALAAYQAERSSAVGVRQQAARVSTAWFENVAEHITVDPVRFAYSLRTRREQPAGLSWVLHRATQYRAGQVARRWVSTAKRRLRAS